MGTKDVAKVLLVLEMEPRAFYRLDKCSAT